MKGCRRVALAAGENHHPRAAVAGRAADHAAHASRRPFTTSSVCSSVMCGKSGNVIVRARIVIGHRQYGRARRVDFEPVRGRVVDARLYAFGRERRADGVAIETAVEHDREEVVGERLGVRAGRRLDSRHVREQRPVAGVDLGPAGVVRVEALEALQPERAARLVDAVVEARARRRRSRTRGRDGGPRTGSSCHAIAAGAGVRRARRRHTPPCRPHPAVGSCSRRSCRRRPGRACPTCPSGRRVPSACAASSRNSRPRSAASARKARVSPGWPP